MADEAQAVSMVVAVCGSRDGHGGYVSRGFLNETETATVLGRRESEELSGKLQVTLRCSSRMH